MTTAQTNRISKVAYQGVNQEALQVQKIRMGYASNEWMTFLQANDCGLKIKKGEKGVRLLKFIEVERMKKGKRVTETAVKGFTVFNEDQTEVFTGIPGLDQ
jgi:antirestriction protein ArdC